MVDVNNQIVLEGNLTHNPELRYTTRGTPVVEFSIAYNRQYREPVNGDFKRVVSYFDCRAFGDDAYAISRLFEKGDTAGICGQLQQDRWKDRDGKTRSQIYIVVRDYELVRRPKRKTATGGDSARQFTTEVVVSAGTK
jgi:single-strand DNA-binding protein